jgi:hypothetical protein
MKNMYENKERINELFKQEKKQNNIQKNKDLTLFESSKNFISKEIYFSTSQNQSQSESSNEDTSSLSQRNSSYNQTSNLLLS